MPAIAQVSFTNWFLDGATYALTSQQAAWPATLLGVPEPLLPWRTSSTVQNDIARDFGTPRPVALIVVSNCNYVNIEFFLAEDSAFTVGLLHAVLTPRIVYDTGRYQLGYLWPGSPVRRYMLMRIPAQTPVTGASYFETGHLHVGPITLEMPSDTRWDYVYKPYEGFEDLRGRGGSQRGRLYTDDPYVTISGRRLGDIDGMSPGNADDLEAWKAIDRAMRDAKHFAFFENAEHAGHAWIMRRVNGPEWRVGYPFAEDDLTLEEVITP